MKSLFLFLLLLPLSVKAETLLSDDPTFGFGVVPLGTEVKHTFTLKNTTKKTLVIGKITTSCTCTKVVAFPDKIAAGDSGAFDVVQLRPQTGVADVFVYVPTGQAASDLHTFRIVGLVVDKAKAEASTNQMISAQEVVNHLPDKSLVLVDVRPQEPYAETHAQGSQSLPPFALETRPAWKTKNVVLINDGLNEPELLARIDRLKTAGFQNVHLLNGGLRAWQMAGGKMEGAALPQAPNLALLSAANFNAKQQSAQPWLVLTTDKNPQPFDTTYPVKNVPLGSDPKDFAKRLSATLATVPTGTRVLITNTLGHGYNLIEPALRDAKITTPIYYLQGGTWAYHTQTQAQSLALTTQKVTLRNDDAYLASARTTGQITRGAGCSSCGH